MSARAEVLAALHDVLPELESRFGVSSLWLFGSMARGDDTARSNVNLLAEFSRPVSLFNLAHLRRHLCTLLGRPVELGTVEGLSAGAREEIMAERVRVS